MEESVDILMVTFNRLDYTKRTLASLLETMPGDIPMFIHIIDNASTEEGMRDYLRDLERLGSISVTQLKENLGWGAAVNIGLRNCINEWILLVNNDVEFKSYWWPQAKGLFDKYGDAIGILGLWKHIAHGLIEDKGDLIIKDDMPAVAWLMKKQTMDIIGPIDERGPCATKGGNGEDTNYAMRMQDEGYWVCAPKEDLAVHIDLY